MSTAFQTITADELDQFPNDGKRREIIGGELHVSPAPARPHQELSIHLAVILYRHIVETGAGMVYTAPVDVRFSDLDQVQPDLLAIRQNRLDIYQGHTVYGPPDIVVEIISPSNPGYDTIEKQELYAASDVPEYWLIDPALRQFTMLCLREGEYQPVELEDGQLRSTSVVEFAIDPDVLFGKLSG